MESDTMSTLSIMRRNSVRIDRAAGGGFCLTINGVDIGWHRSRRAAIVIAARIFGREFR
jgi:hypothetical protein